MNKQQSKVVFVNWEDYLTFFSAELYERHKCLYFQRPTGLSSSRISMITTKIRIWKAYRLPQLMFRKPSMRLRREERVSQMMESLPVPCEASSMSSVAWQEV